MKTLLRRLLGIAVLIAGFSRSDAQIIPLSVHSSLSVGGAAIVPIEFGGEHESYSITHTTDGIYFHSDSMSGEATAHLTILPPFEIYLGTLLQAGSSAEQSMSVNPGGIDVFSSIQAYASMFSQVGTRGSWAESIVEVEFSVPQPVAYMLTANVSFLLDDYPYNPGGVSTTIRSTSGVEVFSFQSTSMYTYLSIDAADPLRGYMQPGSYVFRSDTYGPGGVCPLGHGTAGSQAFTLSVSSVAVLDQSPTGVLLALSMTVVCAARRFLSNAEGLVR